MGKSDLFDIKTRLSGQVIFVIASFAVSLGLLSQIGSQTEWSDSARTIAAQPRFWPAVALGLMVAGFGLHWRLMRRRRPDRRDWLEAKRWVEPLEYYGWFILFVLAVPRLGFLPMSLVMACALTWRLGYRSKGALALAALFAVSVTVTFKGFLGVNIPGGQIYELLPASVRTFFMVYL
ncbi:tripartite tricarboxylate transporter TctB family protein [Roseicyclus sp.]